MSALNRICGCILQKAKDVKTETSHFMSRPVVPVNTDT